MHVFVTGASGWVGSAVVEEMIAAGHQVTGLARSDEKAALVVAAGAQVLRGSMDNLAVLHKAAAAADAVVHTAFNHDFSKFAENAEQDRRAIEALGAGLKGSRRPLVVTSGLADFTPDATEAAVQKSDALRKSEQAARALVEQGVNAIVVRLPPSVHGVGDHGFARILIDLAKKTGVSAFLGNGENLWAGTHRLDVARLYRLVLERNLAHPVYHAVADAGVPFRQIAEAIGQSLNLPVASRGPEHFGWFAMMVGRHLSASSEATKKWLAWRPNQSSLLAELKTQGY